MFTFRNGLRKVLQLLRALKRIIVRKIKRKSKRQRQLRKPNAKSWYFFIICYNIKKKKKNIIWVTSVNIFIGSKHLQFLYCRKEEEKLAAEEEKKKKIAETIKKQQVLLQYRYTGYRLFLKWILGRKRTIKMHSLKKCFVIFKKDFLKEKKTC